MNQHLPSLYFIRGIAGVIFKDPLSAKRWLKENGLPDKEVKVVDVIYYGSNLTSDMKTTEDLQKKSLDKVL